MRGRVQRYNVGYWRSGPTAILPPPKVVSMPVAPLSPPIFAVITAILPLSTPFLPHPADCCPGRSTPPGYATKRLNPRPRQIQRCFMTMWNMYMCLCACALVEQIQSAETEAAVRD